MDTVRVRYLSIISVAKTDKNCISFNPAYKNASLKDNEYIIRSSGDVVSSLSAPKKFMTSILYPNWSKEHLVTIPAKTNNPLTEHKIDILDRVDPNKKIGRGGSKCSCEKKRNSKTIFSMFVSQLCSKTPTETLGIRNNLKLSNIVNIDY